MRIRTVKPEWLDDELLAAGSDEARVLSISLLLVADDHGRGRASIASIAATTWRYQMERDGGEHAPEILARASRALRELAEIDFVHLYEVNRQRYFAIRNWNKHQKVDHPSKPRVPGPEEAENTEESINSRDTREDLAKDSREHRETLATDPDQDPDPDQDHELKTPDGVSSESCTPTPRDSPSRLERDSETRQPDPKPAPTPTTNPDPVREVWDAYLEEHIDPSKRARCKLNGKRRQKIKARLREGYGPERQIAAIRGVKKSSFHMGENAEGKRWTGLEVILRDGAQVEKFEALLNAPDPPVPRGGKRPSVAQAYPPEAFMDADEARADFERQIAASRGQA